MHKTTVYLPEQLKEALGYKARSERKSEAQVIREAIEVATKTYLHRPKPTLPLFTGHGDLAQHVDEILAEGFGQD